MLVSTQQDSAVKVERCGGGVFASTIKKRKKKERNLKEQRLGFRSGGPPLLNECRGNTASHDAVLRQPISVEILQMSMTS